MRQSMEKRATGPNSLLDGPRGDGKKEQIEKNKEKDSYPASGLGWIRPNGACI